MRAVFASLTVVTALFATRPALADDPDPWFGKDKALHFGVSVGLAGAGYGVSTLFIDDRAGRALTGAGFSLALGAGKELYDLTGHGDPSWKDFTWDIAGTAVGVGVALLIDVLVSKDTKDAKLEPRAQGTQLTIQF